jgi:hypothetical protein
MLNVTGDHMTKRADLTSSVITVVVIFACCEPLLAASGSSRFGPIGTARSVTGFKIDGRFIQGEGLLWGGELLEACNEGGASVVLDSVGAITMAAHTRARLMVAGRGQATLIAQVIAGRLTVKLDPGVEAYIETRNRVFFEKSSTFQVEAGGPDESVPAVGGIVKTDPTKPQPQPVGIRRVTVNASGQPTGFAPNEVRSRTKRLLLIYFSVRSLITGNLVPSRRLIATLSNPLAGSVGSQTATVTSDQFGVATVRFTAGSNKALSLLTVSDGESVPGSQEWVGEITVTGGFFSLSSLAVAGLPAIATICAFQCGPKRRSLLQIPPPDIP